MPCAMQIFWCACGSPQPDLDGPCGSLAEFVIFPRQKKNAAVCFKTATLERQKKHRCLSNDHDMPTSDSTSHAIGSMQIRFQSLNVNWGWASHSGASLSGM